MKKDSREATRESRGGGAMAARLVRGIVTRSSSKAAVGVSTEDRSDAKEPFSNFQRPDRSRRWDQGTQIRESSPDATIKHLEGEQKVFLKHVKEPAMGPQNP